MAWAKGQSGNTKGRPPKKRALTDLLEKTGKRKLESGGTAKELFARKVWEGLTTGMITFNAPTGDIPILLGAQEYIALARLVLTQIDGPPPAAVDVTTAGQPVNAAIFINGVESRSQPPALELREDDAD